MKQKKEQKETTRRISQQRSVVVEPVYMHVERNRRIYHVRIAQIGARKRTIPVADPGVEKTNCF